MRKLQKGSLATLLSTAGRGAQKPVSAPKSKERFPARVLPESNNMLNPNFAMPEVVQLRTLEVLMEIRDLLKKK